MRSGKNIFKKTSRSSSPHALHNARVLPPTFRPPVARNSARLKSGVSVCVGQARLFVGGTVV